MRARNRKNRILKLTLGILIWIVKSTFYGLIVSAGCLLIWYFIGITLPFIQIALKAIGS